jgi:transcriptional regulator GlxA family with amidase domain
LAPSGRRIASDRTTKSSLSSVEERKPDTAAVQWLRQAAAESRRVGSICTSAFLLAHAGLLDGRPVATHWAFAAELAKRYPKVKVDPEPIWVQDGNFYTSAGVTAGIHSSNGSSE